MKHIYTVNPVECQPQWPEKPAPIRYPWGDSMLSVAVIALAAYIIITGFYAGYLLAEGL